LIPPRTPIQKPPCLRDRTGEYSVDVAEAGRLAQHPVVRRSVRQLGDPDHPHADRIARLLDSHGGVLTFVLSSVAEADRLCASVRLISHSSRF